MSDPLREPTFLILAALAPQPLHGYAIIGEVADLSGGRLALRPGTLYGALDRRLTRGCSSRTGKKWSMAGCAATTGSPTPGRPSWSGKPPAAGQRRRGAATALPAAGQTGLASRGCGWK